MYVLGEGRGQLAVAIPFVLANTFLVRGGGGGGDRTGAETTQSRPNEQQLDGSFLIQF